MILLGFACGVWPKPVGARLDPHDAYREQFVVMTQPEILSAHAQLLTLECLPRLFAGHRLPGLETDPDPAVLAGRSSYHQSHEFELLGAGVVGLSALLACLALAALVKTVLSAAIVARYIILGLLLSAAATMASFVVNRNIFNSDNYRYLVTLLVPWSLGLGIAARSLAERGRPWRNVLLGLCLLIGVVMTADVARWYARFGWIDGRGLPVRKGVDDPLLAWLERNRDVEWIEGGYWDVYRLAFLTGGRVRGAPFPIYPNRFPDWSPPTGKRRVTLVRLTPEGRFFLEKAIRDGARVVDRVRGVTILEPR